MKYPSRNILILLLLIFIIFDIQPPEFLSKLLHTSMGKVSLLIVSLYLFTIGPFVGFLALTSAYLLSKNSNKVIDIIKNRNVKKFIPSEKNKQEFFENTLNNHFPKTLEEEVVKDDVPLIKDFPTIESSYIPVVNYSHNADKFSLFGLS
tara:strand:+ start:682 stop:1128 length:447 start_codon:yes stop_codon:yes gene_type:complete